MARSSGQKLKLVYLADIFKEKTDEMHPMSLQQLIGELENRGVAAERKSIYTDIEALCDEYGMDICKRREGNTTYYFLGSRDFEMPELQLLVDAVACSKFISADKSRILIDKISRLAGEHQAKALKRNVMVANRVKNENEVIYYSIQRIHEAIEEGRAISFLYFDYDIRKNKKYRRDKKRYVMSPYSLAWENESYYCIGYHHARQTISNFRVDRMEAVEISNEIFVLKDGKPFDVTEYSKKVFDMFAGETVRAQLVFHNSLINNVIDKFGKSVTMRKVDDEHFCISKDVNVSPPFFAWIFQFGSKAKIEGPESLKEKMREHIQKAIDSMNTIY